MAGNFNSKVHEIYDILEKMDRNERKIIIKFIIMHDLKLYMEVLHEEQVRLEKELGIKGVEEYEELDDGKGFDSINANKDGYLGYCGGEKT